MKTRWTTSVVGFFVLSIASGIILSKAEVTQPPPTRETTSRPTRGYFFSADEYCDAINRAENSKRYPYGIRSVKCVGEAECRRVCKNTVNNNKERYLRMGLSSKQGFLDFLASRYCPVGGELDNGTCRHWKKNVAWFLKEGRDG